MKLEAKQLRDKITKITEELSGAEKNLASLVTHCSHQFSPTVYDPIITQAFTDPGDPPGTMGVDWQGPMYVPEHVEKRWRRTCEYCGEVEYTKLIRQKIEELPQWPEGR